MTPLGKAIAIAMEAHDGQFDKADQPYILHPLRVMRAMRTEEEQIAAVLHDVIEDAPKSFNARYKIVDAFGGLMFLTVNALTKRDGEAYDDYLKRVKSNPIARAVKIADIQDNTSPERIGNISAKQRLKYEAALLFLRMDDEEAQTA